MGRKLLLNPPPRQAPETSEKPTADTVTASHNMLVLQREAAWAEERFLGDLRQSVPQNGRVHLHILELILPALLQKLVSEFFSIFGREIWREIWRVFCRIFRTHKIKAQNFGENFGAFLIREFVAQQKKHSCKVRSADVRP